MRNQNGHNIPVGDRLSESILLCEAVATPTFSKTTCSVIILSYFILILLLAFRALLLASSLDPSLRVPPVGGVLRTYSLMLRWTDGVLFVLVLLCGALV